MKAFQLFLAIILSLAFFECSMGADKEDLEKLGAKLRIQNGQIVDLRADCKDWSVDDFRLVAKQKSLKGLTLSGKTINDQTLSILGDLENIEGLSFNNAQITNPGFDHFKKFSNLKRLSFFHLSRDIADFDGTGFQKLKSLKKLRQLTHAGAKTGNECMKAISELSQLESYSQWHNLETAEGMKHLLNLKNLKSLRIGQRLHDWKPPIKPASFDNKTFLLIEQMKSLEALDIMEARLDYEALVRLKNLPKLKRLNARLVEMPQSDVEKLSKQLANVKVDWKPLTQKEEQDVLKKKLKI